jgi:hypothetical protein
MFLRITIAIALVLGMASGALAAPKQKHNASRAYFHDTHAHHGGSASRVRTTHARTTYAKTRHAKTAHVKAKHVAIKAYGRYRSHNWSFGSAASTLAMANANNSNRHHTPGQASHAAATQQRHSSNPSYDVYNTRGWYTGSDPDATVRFMMEMDPASVD